MQQAINQNTQAVQSAECHVQGSAALQVQQHACGARIIAFPQTTGSSAPDASGEAGSRDATSRLRAGISKALARSIIASDLRGASLKGSGFSTSQRWQLALMCGLYILLGLAGILLAW